MPTRLLAALRVCSCLLCPYKDQTGRQVLAFPTGVALFPIPPSSLLPLGFRHTHAHKHPRTCSRLSRASVHVPLSVSVHALSPFYLGWKLSHDPPTTPHTRRPESTIWWSNLTHLAAHSLPDLPDVFQGCRFGPLSSPSSLFSHTLSTTSGISRRTNLARSVVLISRSIYPLLESVLDASVPRALGSTARTMMVDNDGQQ